MEINMEKAYDPQSFENDLYREWEESGAFKAHRVAGKKPFTIVMPPPNITGQLHMGHAMDCTLQDSIIRYHRMKGDPTLWLPGTDHAAIATEVKIVDAMRKEGLTKEMIGREAFLERAWKWKEEYGGRITRQQRKLGSSCDWSRERFTMDEGCSKAVREVFVNLYEKKLIYRGNRLVNWCPCCGTSLSDAEVEYEPQKSYFWHLLYPVKETGEYLELATTRPETMLGDTAVAINPEDPRFAHLHGCHVILPLIGKEIPIVCDEHADMEKGTGVVKITPAHDPNDYEVGQRHGLPVVRVFTYDGYMTGAADKADNDELFASGKATVGEPLVLDCGKYAGMTTADARKVIVEDLKAAGLLKRIEPLEHEVGTCYRCHTTVEPMVSKQWFVKMKPLAEPAIAAVTTGKTEFVPERFTKTYMNWMENIRDWCISRHLWWGHRIPAWECENCGEITVSRTDVCQCPKCGGKVKQDEDVLDTWFSSALWPFSTLGWPDQTEDVKYFYPTTTLVTGYDIIFFWVARMIFSGCEQMGETPFKTVLIHGLVRDAFGRKMSKSLGNGIDPLDLISEFGADALRFSLVMGISAGADVRYGNLDEKLLKKLTLEQASEMAMTEARKKPEASRNFANKVWNASRFVLMNLDENTGNIDPAKLSIADKWILTRLDETIREMTQHFENYDLGLAAQKIYDFAWNEFCDWYIELAKVNLNNENRMSTCAVLRHVLIDILKLLHPFMPFITDKIYRNVPGTEGTVMLAAWPTADDALVFPVEAREMEGIMDVIRAVRNLRAEMNVAVGKRAHLIVRPKEGWHEAMDNASDYLARLAWVSETSLLADGADAPGKTVSAVCNAAELFIPLGDLVDTVKEIARVTKERDNVQREIERAEGKLNNPGFVNKAPAHLIEQEKEKLVLNRDKLAKLNARLEDLANL